MSWFVQIAVYHILQKNMTFAVIVNLPTKLNDVLFDVVILCLIIWNYFTSVHLVTCSYFFHVSNLKFKTLVQSHD